MELSPKKKGDINKQLEKNIVNKATEAIEINDQTKAKQEGSKNTINLLKREKQEVVKVAENTEKMLMELQKNIESVSFILEQVNFNDKDNELFLQNPKYIKLITDENKLIKVLEAFSKKKNKSHNNEQIIFEKIINTKFS
jgi:hypothetical protein